MTRITNGGGQRRGDGCPGDIGTERDLSHLMRNEVVVLHDSEWMIVLRRAHIGHCQDIRSGGLRTANVHGNCNSENTNK